MKPIAIEAHRAYPQSAHSDKQVKPVSNRFFHNAIIGWEIFVALLTVVIFPISIVALLIRKIRRGEQ